MRYRALACDYDGTLAKTGVVASETVEALEVFKAKGGLLILVTGRILGELFDIFPETGLFDRIVAENGAVVRRPTGETTVLAKAPPPEFARVLAERGAHPIHAGKVIVSTVRPHESTVLEVIREFGLELHIIFNKEAVMVLPSGVNKAGY